MENILQIHPSDNVAVALRDLPLGYTVYLDKESFPLANAIPQKHKFSLGSIKQGEEIRMYGVKVGQAAKDINKGDLLTVDNIVHATSKVVVKKSKCKWNAPDVNDLKNITWQGYYREDSRIGTRNHWLVIPLVFCENHNVEILQKVFDEQLGYGRSHHQYDLSALKKKYAPSSFKLPVEETVHTTNQRFFKNVEDIKYLTHHSGCGGTRNDAHMLVRLLAAYISHPNTAGATILSLGCQNAQMHMLKDELKRIAPDYSRPLVWAEQQQLGSGKDFMEYLVRESFEAMVKADQYKREQAPVSVLTLGLECGGSDGFSGISANPALGELSDRLVALGGSAVLSEFPELNGVEQELIDRCESTILAERFEQLMKAYEEQAKKAGSSFAANPSPGNIKDGLLTDAMKSAGAAKKGGTSPIVDVLDYTDILTKNGLNLLCTPGNDVESTTALAASGANLIAFTTGLGTPTGNPLSPVIKLSSNTHLAQRMKDVIDLDCGDIITGQSTPVGKSKELLELLLEVASGKIFTKAEQLGQNDFIPWKRDISL